MLLRESGEYSGKPHALDVINALGTQNSTVAHASVLLNFADAAVADDASALAIASDALCEELGEEALVDSAALVAIFSAVVKIADATGIPLEEYKAKETRALRTELGIDDYGIR